MFLNKVRRLISKQSLKIKLTTVFVLIFGATTILFNVTLFIYMIKALEDDYDIALYNYAVDVSNSIALNSDPGTGLSPLVVDQGKILPFPLGNALILVRDGQGKILSKIGDLDGLSLPFEKDFKKLSNDEEVSYRTIKFKSNEAESYRIISLNIDEQKSYYLQIAAPLTLLEKQIDKRFDLLKYGIPIVLLIAAAAGLLLSNRALKPIREIMDSAKNLDVRDLSRRVPVAETQDEIQQLGQTINEMLGRIENAFQSQEKFIADASHQLQTPLAILRGELEQALRHQPDPKIVNESVQSSLQEVDSLSKIVSDMLLLARIDAGMGSLQKQEVFLDELLMDLISRLEKKSIQKNIRIKVNLLNAELRASTLCDDDLITHAFSNIIENAIKYSPENSTVTITLEWTRESSIVLIQDEGPGFPEEFKAHLFERFSRDSSVSSRVKGYGLGLAIAQRIAVLHKADLTASHRDSGGAEFKFQIKNF